MIQIEFTNEKCQCYSHLSPYTPRGSVVRLLKDGVQLGFYCSAGCLPGMLDACEFPIVGAESMRETTKVGDTVLWSGIEMEVLETGDYGVRTDHGLYTWEVVSRPDV